MRAMGDGRWASGHGQGAKGAGTWPLHIAIARCPWPIAMQIALCTSPIELETPERRKRIDARGSKGGDRAGGQGRGEDDGGGA